LQYVSSQLVGKRTALIIWLWGRQMATWSHDHNFLSLWRLLKFLLPDHLTPIGQLIEIKITYKIHFDHLSKRESRDLNALMVWKMTFKKFCSLESLFFLCFPF
jgi:hypothetical protein